MDDETESLLMEIVVMIKEALEYHIDINVYILYNQSLNAAATQSGDIVVNAGVFLQCDDVYELIAILAHEVGHIAGAHIATFIAGQGDRARHGLVATLIGAAAAIAAGNPAPLIAGTAGGSSIMMGTTFRELRKRENIADTKAAQAIIALGWEMVFPGCVSLHEKLSRNSGGIYNVYLSTHPLPQDRIDKYKKYTRDSEGKTWTQKVQSLMARFQRKFAILKHKIRALVLPVDTLSAMYARAEDFGERYAKAITFYRAHKYESASTTIDGLVEKADQADVGYLMEIKAMSLACMKKLAVAASTCWTILVDDKPTKVHRDLGLIYAHAVVEGKLKNHASQAIKVLSRINAVKGDDVSVISELGALHFMSGDTDKASLCAAKVSSLLGDPKTAIFHAEKAAKSTNEVVKRNAKDISSSQKELIDD
jgi:predicted Zn-dependent protease